MAVGGEAQPITMKNKQSRQGNNEHRTQICMLLFGKRNFYYLLFCLNLLL